MCSDFSLFWHLCRNTIFVNVNQNMRLHCSFSILLFSMTFLPVGNLALKQTSNPPNSSASTFVKYLFRLKHERLEKKELLVIKIKGDGSKYYYLHEANWV